MAKAKKAKKAARPAKKIMPPVGAVWSSHLATNMAAGSNVQYRAYCNTEDNYIGPWRSDLNAEQQDEAAHKAQSGSAEHSTTYMIKQGT